MGHYELTDHPPSQRAINGSVAARLSWRKGLLARSFAPDAHRCDRRRTNSMAYEACRDDRYGQQTCQHLGAASRIAAADVGLHEFANMMPLLHFLKER